MPATHTPRRRYQATLAVLLLFVIPMGGKAQHSAPTIRDSYTTALSSIERAILGHGGQDALVRAQRVRVTLAGEDIWRNQSRRVQQPYDRRPASVDLMVDVPASRLSFRTSATFPGDLTNTARLVVDDQRAHRVMEGVGQHRVDRPSNVATNLVPLIFVPQLLLAQARAGAPSLRSLGQVTLSSGRVVDAVTFTIPGGSAMTIGLDRSTGLLAAIVSIQSDPLAGDTQQEIEFLDYRPLNGLLLPTRRLQRMAGELTQELNYRSAQVDHAIPDSSLAIPAGSVPLDRNPPAERVRALAPGIFQIWLFGLWITAATVGDYSVVFEAPGRSATEVAAQLARVAPGKPIRYVVLTHHHDDHAGGVADYAAAGATIVTTPANRAYIERMVAARSQIGATTPLVAPTPVKIETIAAGGHRTFSDGTVSIEVHHAGANEHVEEMLMGWMPGPGAVLEADLINLAPNGSVPPGANIAATRTFAAWLKSQPWQVRQLLSLHHDAKPASVLDEILRLPPSPR